MIIPKFILLSIFIVLTFTQFFQNSPVNNFYSGSNNPLCVEIAGDQSKIFVGFNSGLIKTYDMNGNYLTTYNTTLTGNIIQIEWAPLGLGVLDSNNVYSAFGSNGVLAGSIAFNSSLKGVSFTQNGNNLFGAFNFGSTALQFDVSVSNGSFNQATTYTLNNLTITAFKFSPGSQYLVAGGNDSYVYEVNATSGYVQNYTFNTGSPVVKFSYYLNDMMLLLTQNKNIYMFTSTKHLNVMNQSSTTANTFIGCPSGLIVTGIQGTSNMNVYLQNGNFLQTLNYSKNTVTYVDCSSNYLVSLDANGYVAIDQFVDIDIKKLAAWVIAIIVVFSVLCCAGILLLIYCCWRRRQQAILLNNTSGKELMFANNNNITPRM